MKKGLIFMFLVFSGWVGVYAQMQFGTWTQLGGEGNFKTINDDGSAAFDAQNVALQANSLLKFQGQALPHLWMFTEVKVAEVYRDIWRKGGIDLDDGVQHAVTDLLSNPINYASNDGANAGINEIHMVFQTPYLDTDLGFKYAKLPYHQNANWTTIDYNWDAGYDSTGGYLVFKLGDALRNIGPLNINANIGPNKSADRSGHQYGFFGWVMGEYMENTVDFQYNGAYGYDYGTVFDKIYESDYILGYKGKVEQLEIRANFLVNYYEDFYTPSSSDVGLVDPQAGFSDNIAAKIALSTKHDIFDATVGYYLRGAQANLMYLKHADGDEHIKDQLGDRNVQTPFVDITVSPVTVPIKIRSEAGVHFVFNKDAAYSIFNDRDTLQIHISPAVSYSTAQITGIESSISVNGELMWNSTEKDKFKRGTDTSPFLLNKCGARFEIGSMNRIITGMTVQYGFDNTDESYQFHELWAAIGLPQDCNIQAGLGFRAANAGISNSDTPFGFFTGFSRRLRAAARAVVYAQFVYNMDPYKKFTDGQDNLDIDGYVLYGGVNKQAGWAALRCGIRWDF
ncbi:MAG: hypothetical protein Ta2B_03420 [Termitinemataceae bacterium]|nr:MAG: hypothetical protein Ta2B_03420 [Termitinemataceae bacterium]